MRSDEPRSAHTPDLMAVEASSEAKRWDRLSAVWWLGRAVHPADSPAPPFSQTASMRIWVTYRHEARARCKKTRESLVKRMMASHPLERRNRLMTARRLLNPDCNWPFDAPTLGEA
jgi:hypothetical protein